MNIFIEQLRDNPFIALFLSLGLGYLLGKLKIGKFQLGGVAGSLIVAVLIGQFGGIEINNSIKSVFFALFIFMVGYNGGPQFFSSFNRSSFTRLIAAFMMCFVGLLTVLVCAMWAGLDKGLAAGLAAGGLTQSAIIGTAGNAIDLLGLSVNEAAEMKTNVAVGYSITYIFGSLGPILMVSIIPIICGWNLREEAVKLAKKLGGGAVQLNEGEFIALNRVAYRAYNVAEDSEFAGLTGPQINNKLADDLSLEKIYVLNDSEEEKIALDTDQKIQAGDILFISGLRKDFASLTSMGLVEKGEFDQSINLVQVQRKLVLTNKKLANLSIKEIHDKVNKAQRNGVYISQVTRLGHDMSTLPETKLHLGDEITLIGDAKAVAKLEKNVGYSSPMPSFTDFTIFSFGMVLGFLIGEISFTINGTTMSLGSGLGCLISGLFVGYLRMRQPRFGAINAGAANFMQNFGLTVFVAVVGINAGAPALTAIQEHGMTLLLLGFVVTLVPQLLVVAFNFYVLKIKNPVEAMAVMVGSRSANPGFATLLEKTGNSTPVASFTLTYAVANIFLTLWGPIIVALVK
ncbi:MAG: aspartate-alanine antiporter [Psychromonas sp.]